MFTVIAALAARPPIAQQITWLYANDLDNGADFLATNIGLDEVLNTKQKDKCRVFHAAPGVYLGVCNTRPAPTCPSGPEEPGEPVTYTIVVETRAEVDAWHEHLVAASANRTIVHAPGVFTEGYYFNFFDANRDSGLGCYRFEVQSFEDPAWPAPECEPIAAAAVEFEALAALAPTSRSTVPARATRPLSPAHARSAAKPRVTLDLFLASKCPDAPRCERLVTPMLQSGVGSLVDVRLGYVDVHPNGSAPSGFDCMHGPTECVGNLAQLCVQQYWPYHVDTEVSGLPANLNWMLFLRCAAEADEDGAPFNSTASSRIPGNTNACLQRYGVPAATADAIEECVDGPEGRALLTQSMERTLATCGAHEPEPRIGCKSCSMYLEGQQVCVVDEGIVYNCTGLGTDTANWTAAVCAAARAKGYADVELPLVCRLAAQASMTAPQTAAWPTVHGHSYASTDPRASADFAIKYFGATLHGDFRGGGLELHFVSNPRKPAGSYDIAAHVAAMATLFGNLSDNSGHHWNQYFDNHLGFYARPSDTIVEELLRDGVPFFTGQSDGMYQSIYVAIPGTGHVVEVLGDFYLADLPPNHVRFSSTTQFCSPKRRRRRALAATHASHGPTVSASSARSNALDPNELGINYHNGDADLNKTTMAGADPEAAIAFAVQYLGGSPIQQHRGPQGDGPCTKLSWAEWPDLHQWHVVNYKSADWVTFDQLRPIVPFNISDLAQYVEALRDLRAHRYDAWLDYREILRVGNLTEMADVLRADGVPFGVWARPSERTCSLYVNLPNNGLAVELVSSEFSGKWLHSQCASSPFDLCAAT